MLNFSTPSSQLSHLGPEGFCIVLGSSISEWGTPVLGARGTDINLSPSPLPCRLLGIGNPTYKASPLGRLYLLTPPVQALSTFSLPFEPRVKHIWEKFREEAHMDSVCWVWWGAGYPQCSLGGGAVGSQ